MKTLFTGNKEFPVRIPAAPWGKEHRPKHFWLGLHNLKLNSALTWEEVANKPVCFINANPSLVGGHVRGQGLGTVLSIIETLAIVLKGTDCRVNSSVSSSQ